MEWVAKCDGLRRFEVYASARLVLGLGMFGLEATKAVDVILANISEDLRPGVFIHVFKDIVPFIV